MRLKLRRKQEEQELNALPDLSCCVCIHRRECGQAEENKFCSRFASRKFQGADPNGTWEEMRKGKAKKASEKAQ